jgi:hypothetical protein
MCIENIARMHDEVTLVDDFRDSRI